MHTNHFPFSFRIVASLILPSMSLLCLTSMYPSLFKRSLLSSHLIEAFIPFLVLYSLFLSVKDSMMEELDTPSSNPLKKIQYDPSHSETTNIKLKLE